jgi:hypothetical protein
MMPKFKTFLVTILTISISEVLALEFRTGVYDLIKGDEKKCEEGPLLIKDDQLIFGSRYVFVNFKKPSVEFQNDEKNCSYFIKNIHTEKTYEQQMIIKCFKATPVKKVVQFHYSSTDKLVMDINSDEFNQRCELLWKK